MDHSQPLCPTGERMTRLDPPQAGRAPARPLLTVDFNTQHEDGSMWARRGEYSLEIGQIVTLDDKEGLACDGQVVDVAPPNHKGESVPDYVVVIPVDGTWRDS